ncbi:DUF2793 domain-containing protein [Aliihoeflea sp. 2WW]|uniref:DUF2793 domain-containing protein n=1 Tax=Aliihoeflea sp. 2WW TaxID=1381123 RepID=UPI000463B4F0|nr:DUF2793 domain-containing protein [Aliihoeflea sp. 2WW]
MTATPHLDLPFILPSQAQKHVTHNEALRILDAVVQLSVASRTEAAPAGDISEGVRYIVPAGASAPWAGQDGRVALAQDGGWTFLTPREGWLAWVRDDGELVVHDGAAWSKVTSGGTDADMLGLNATASEANRLAVSSPASLFSHEGDSHRLTVNKATAADTASLLFQTGFSGRAEMGTAGTDNFHIKLSQDGTTWKEAVVIDAADGAPTLPHGLRIGDGSLLSTFQSGDFTPTLTFASPGDLSVSYATQAGAYWRIGDLVIALVHVAATPVYGTASGQLRIAGLPVPVGDPMVANTFQHGSGTTYPPNAQTLVTRPEASTTFFTCLGLGPGVASALTVANVPSGQGFVARGLLVYRAAS